MAPNGSGEEKYPWPGPHAASTTEDHQFLWLWVTWIGSARPGGFALVLLSLGVASKLSGQVLRTWAWCTLTVQMYCAFPDNISWQIPPLFLLGMARDSRMLDPSLLLLSMAKETDNERRGLYSELSLGRASRLWGWSSRETNASTGMAAVPSAQRYEAKWIVCKPSCLARALVKSQVDRAELKRWVSLMCITGPRMQ